MHLLTALNWRYAVREFSDTALPETRLNTLLEATRLSASSYGLQPYKLAVIRSMALRQRLLEHSYGQQKVLASSHLIVFAFETDIGDHTVDRYVQQRLGKDTDPKPDFMAYVDHMKSALAAKSKEDKQTWAREQAYIALGTFLTSAAILGIDTCPMTGFDSGAYDRLLGFEELGLRSAAIAAVGERSPNDAAAAQTKIRRNREAFILEYP